MVSTYVSEIEFGISWWVENGFEDVLLRLIMGALNAKAVSDYYIGNQVAELVLSVTLGRGVEVDATPERLEYMLTIFPLFAQYFITYMLEPYGY